MSDLAVIDAQVVDIQNDRMHKGSIKITLHVPAEAGPHLTKVLGWPTYANPVPVALARLSTNNQKPPPNQEGERKRRLYARIAILCQTPTFLEYVGEVTDCAGIGVEDAAAYVRKVCQVDSRADITPGSPAEKLFLKLEDDFAQRKVQWDLEGKW